MNISPYLSFEGRCDEAIEFYKSAAGAEVAMLVRFKDAPAGSCAEGGVPPANHDKVMHAELQIGNSKVFATDGHCSGQAKFDGISLSVAASSEKQAQRLFNALSAGGTVTMPLGKTFFAPCFGMVADRFGVHWMIIVNA
jgi:PhnB protein